MASKLRRYWDSDCCFGYLANQSGRGDECERVLAEAEEGKCEIVISALTIAEVLHLRDGRGFARESRDRIRRFFRRECFTVADVDRFVAEQAADVFWDHGIMPKDAVHVATALASNAHYLETFDRGLLEKSRQLGGDPQLVIQHPGADIERRAREKEQQVDLLGGGAERLL